MLLCYNATAVELEIVPALCAACLWSKRSEKIMIHVDSCVREKQNTEGA